MGSEPFVSYVGMWRDALFGKTLFDRTLARIAILVIHSVVILAGMIVVTTIHRAYRA